jgi:hypothetical protein
MQIALQKMASYYIRQTFEKILADQKDRGLPLLSTDDYTPFLGTPHLSLASLPTY